jgi:hypothetical protein
MSPVSVMGSRRPSIDGMSSTCTSQSEVRSFKDRLREHVNQVKVGWTVFFIITQVLTVKLFFRKEPQTR